jgi:hypothetical protein
MFRRQRRAFLYPYQWRIGDCRRAFFRQRMSRHEGRMGSRFLDGHLFATVRRMDQADSACAWIAIAVIAACDVEQALQKMKNPA